MTSPLNKILLGGEQVLNAAIQAQTGVAVPGAPVATSMVFSVGATKITYQQLVATAKVLEGSAVSTQFKKVIHNIGDVDNDLDVTLQVAKALAGLGIPYANDVVLALEVIKFGYDFGKAAGVHISPGSPSLSYEHDMNFKNR